MAAMEKEARILVTCDTIMFNDTTLLFKKIKGREEFMVG